MPGSTPFPIMRVWPGSGLSFPWCEVTDTDSTSDGQFDCHEGVRYGMVMRVFWSDLLTALQQLLGYSYRDATGRFPIMRRIIPWQHPYFTQLYVRGISSVKGKQLAGTNLDSVDGFLPSPGGGGAGVGQSVNTGPWTDYTYADITIQFWRPPYYVLTDQALPLIGGSGPNAGLPAEFHRYVDKEWHTHTQMFSREGSSFLWAPTRVGGGPPPVPGSPTGSFPGPFGSKLSHTKLTKRWYSIPEACLFGRLADGSPNGIPANLLYTQTQTTNPLTGYVQIPGSPIGMCVNSPIGGGVYDFPVNSGVPNLLQFFGCFMGTLRLDSFEIVPVQLQLPPSLMQIPLFAQNESLSQVQYDVVFHFDLFDPPRSSAIMDSLNFTAGGSQVYQCFKGHNCAPNPVDNFWYLIQTLVAPTIGPTTPTTTPYQYADFTDMFVSL